MKKAFELILHPAKMQKIILLVLMLALTLSLVGCDQTEPTTNQDNVINSAENPLLMDALKIASILKNQDMTALAKYVDPEQGLRFSPYGYINVETALVFTADQLPNLFADTKTYTWGAYDGSGEPMNLTFTEYYNDFIYDYDYLNADTIGNNHIVGHGNSLINIEEAYPGSKFVEFYFPGFEEEYAGMDWSSLRLIFQEKNGLRYLVAIVHDQWTI